MLRYAAITIIIYLCCLVYPVSWCGTKMVSEAITLQTDLIELRLEAPIKAMGEGDMRRVSESLYTVLRDSRGWGSAMFIQTRFSIWVYSDLVPKVREKILQIASVPFEEWEITLVVHRTRDPDVERKAQTSTPGVTLPSALRIG